MSGAASLDSAAVVAFWRDAGPQRWYARDQAFDDAIRSRFAALHAEASAGRLAGWEKTPSGALALLILLDQFSRNLFRGDPRTFAQDGAARRIARAALEAGYDRQVEPALRAFFYLPFMHSEAIADQERCVALCHADVAGANLPYAREHERIIRRFGRFPHRNAVLGRPTSEAEKAFLDAGGFAG